MLTELAKPFTGWTVDQHGTIHTASGYRCTPALIESALWLLGAGAQLHGKHVIFADTPQVTPRKMFELRDLITPDRHSIRLTRRHPATTETPDRLTVLE